MGRHTTPVMRRSYEARLRGGPDDGGVIRVSASPSGEPPDFFHAGPDDGGVYVLAGLPYRDGTLPYWWMATHRRVPSAGGPEGATWTLVSIGGDGSAVTVWHQHGAGATPVRLSAQVAGSASLPDFVGRAFECAECDELTVVSLPPREEPIA